jgi:adenylate cyclase
MLSKFSILSAAYVVLAAVAALVLAALLHVPHSPEHWSADYRTAKLSKQLETQHKSIALVYVSDKSLDRFAYTAPTDRGLLADLVTAIDGAGAKVIGLDFVLDRPTEASKDNALVTAIRDARAQVVMGSIGDSSPGTGANKDFEATFFKRINRPVGHLYFGEHHSSLVISDHVVRTTYDHEDDQPSGKSFAELLAQAAGATQPLQSQYISWLRSPTDGSDTFLSLTADELLAPDDVSLSFRPRELLKDRIVLVGGNFFDRDQHLTPFSVVSDRRYPGLSVHAQIVAQIMDGRSLTLPGPVWEAVLALLAAALGYWSGLKSGHNYLVVELATVAGLILMGVLSFWLLSIIFPYTTTLLAWIAGAAGGHYGKRNSTDH